MIVDKFWRFFWISAGSTLLLGLAVAVSLFVFNTRQGNLLAAIGVNYQEGKDPFEGSTYGALTGGSISLTSGYLYQNSLPLHFTSWTWEATGDWRSFEQVAEGNAALKLQFNKPGGTVGMSGPNVNIQDSKSLSLQVWASADVGDLYIDVYDKNGNARTTQSLGWYTATGVLTPNTWEHIVVPLANLGAQGAISGFSINSKNSGLAFVDAVQLSKVDAPHSIWVAPPEAIAQAFNPFATSSPASIPYTFSPTPDSLSRWYTYFGTFGPGKTGEIEAGPSETTKTTGSMTVFRGGRNWSDYHVDTTINWGQVSVFSLLGRFVDDGNFVSCAFSRYGETAQLYQVIKGESNFISQTPPLPVKDFEPWVGVKMGMEVQGNRVGCFVNGEEVLHATLADVSKNGSVGFETWDPNPAAAPHVIESFRVTQRSGE